MFRTQEACLVVSLLAIGTIGCGSDKGEKDDDKNQAVMKFCNDLSRNGMSTELTVEVGYPDPIRVSAVTGTCTPDVPQPCTPIAVGASVDAVLRNGASVLWQGSLTDVQPGEEWLLLTTVEDDAPALEGGPLRAELECRNVDPFTASAPSEPLSAASQPAARHSAAGWGRLLSGRTPALRRGVF